MFIFSEQIRKIFFFKRPYDTGEIAEKSAAILILFSLFFTWIKFPLSIGKNSFDINSQIYISFGIILLILVILLILGLKAVLPLIVLVVLSFPIMLIGDYLFGYKIYDELYQVSNLIKFAKAHIYEPNIVYYDSGNNLQFPVVLWDSILSKFKLVIHHLGFGYLLTFLCSVFLFIRLGLRQLIVIMTVLILLLLPITVTDYYLSEGKEALLEGNYPKSISYLKRAGSINNVFGNGSLSKTEFFNLELGEALYRSGFTEELQSKFYLANKYEKSGSYQDALNLYRSTKDFLLSKDAAARTLVKKSMVDIDEKRYGSSLASLNSSYLADPDRIETIFYLQYLSSLLDDHLNSLNFGQLLIDKCGNRVLLSDVYNMLAKTYSELGQGQISKRMYKQSLKYYDSLRKSNYPAWEGLAGW